MHDLQISGTYDLEIHGHWFNIDFVPVDLNKRYKVFTNISFFFLIFISTVPLKFIFESRS